MAWLSSVNTNRINLKNVDGKDGETPYKIEKINTGNKNSIRLTMNNDGNQKFEIYGNSCGTGNCSGPGESGHYFDTSGVAWHKKQICIGNRCINLDGNNLCVTDLDGKSNKMCMPIQPQPHPQSIVQQNNSSGELCGPDSCLVISSDGYCISKKDGSEKKCVYLYKNTF